MEAGPELDALVARAVFGRTWTKYPYVVINGRHCDSETWLDYGTPDDPGGGARVGMTPPDYSTDIAAAWIVVEHLKQSRKMAFVLGSNGCSNQISVWFIDGIWALGHQQNDCPDFDDPYLLGAATESTAPLAICNAALKAVATKERGI